MSGTRSLRKAQNAAWVTDNHLRALQKMLKNGYTGEVRLILMSFIPEVAISHYKKTERY